MEPQLRFDGIPPWIANINAYGLVDALVEPKVYILFRFCLIIFHNI